MSANPSAGELIGISKAASAETLAAPHAGTQFNNEVKASTNIDVILNAAEKAEVGDALGFHPIFTAKTSVLSDHKVAYALRGVIRDEMYKTLNTTPEVLTLFVGVSNFELGNATLYDNQANHFSVHGSEAKDISRIGPQALTKLLRKLKERSSKVDRDQVRDGIGKDPSARVLRMVGIKNLLAALHSGDYSGVPRVGQDIWPRVTRLVAFDSTYNWEEKDYIDAFQKTGAVEMYCVMALPYELLFTDMPENETYSVRHYRKNNGIGPLDLSQYSYTDGWTNDGELSYWFNYGAKEISTMVEDSNTYTAINFRSGQSDGYVHKTRAWRTLIAKKALRGENFFLNVEIVVSAGLMRLVKLTKSTSTLPLYRSIELPLHKQYVRIIDMKASYLKDENFGSLVYTSVNAENWWRLVQYLMSLDPKSCTAVNALAWVRRVRCGVSMAGVAYQKRWIMPEEHTITIAIAALMYTGVVLEEAGTAMKNFKKKSEDSRFFRILRDLSWGFVAVSTLGLAVPVSGLVRWMKENSLDLKILQTPEMAKTQLIFPTRKWEKKEDEEEFLVDVGSLVNTIEQESRVKYDSNGDLISLGHDPDCPICLKVSNKMGTQIMQCGYKKDSTITWTMSREEVTAFKTTIITQANLPDTPKPLHETLKASLAHVPNTKVSWTGRIEHISAGPGCGKSHLARKLYGHTTMIVSPFSKLRGDYANQKDEDGNVADMKFRTTHKALEGSGKKVLIVDEFTAFDQRALLICAHNNDADIIYLCGDSRQTRLTKAEGEYIGDHVDLNAISTHTLCVNYRNPQWIVALLNNDHPYSMKANSTKLGKPVFEPLSNASDANGRFVMNFTHASSMFSASQITNSVRSNQGGTFDHVGLIISDTDKMLVENDALFRVGISRHRESITIYVERGTEMERLMRSKLHMDDEGFQTEIENLVKPDMKHLIWEGGAEGGGLSPDLLDVVLNRTNGAKKETKQSVPAPNLGDKITEFGKRIVLAARGGKESGKIEPVPIDQEVVKPSIQWCTADAMDGQLPKEAVERYRAHVRGNVDQYVTEEGLIKTAAVQDFCRDEQISLNYYDVNYTSLGEVTYGNKGYLHLHVVADHTTAIPQWMLEERIFAYHFATFRAKPIDLHKRKELKGFCSEEVADCIRKCEDQEVIALNIDLSDSEYILFDQLTVDITDLRVRLAAFKSRNGGFSVVKRELRSYWDMIYRKIEKDKRTQIKFRELRVMLRGGGFSPVIVDKTDLSILKGPRSKEHSEVAVLFQASSTENSEPSMYVASVNDVELKRVKYRVGWAGKKPTTYSGPLYIAVGMARKAGFKVNAKWVMKEAQKLGLRGELSGTASSNMLKNMQDHFRTNSAGTMGYHILQYQTTVRSMGYSCLLMPNMANRNVYSRDPNEDNEICETFFEEKPTGAWKDESNVVPVNHVNVPTSQRLVMEALGVMYLKEDYAPAPSPEVGFRIDERPIHPSRDAYLLADTFSPVFRIDKTALNEEAARQGLLNVPRNGELSADWLNPVNARGHPVNIRQRARKGLAMCIGEGLKFDGNNNLQAVQTACWRYLRRRKVFAFNNQAKMLAHDIADTWVRERQKPLVIDPIKEADIVRQWEYDAQTRKYEQRRKGEGEHNTRLIRHHLKDMFKPTKDIRVSPNGALLDAVNTLKVGQGISAWSSHAVISFGAIVRIINHRWISCLRDHTIYNNKYTEEELDDLIAAAEKKYSVMGAKTGVTDGTEFDSMQNRFTQEIERRHCAHLQVPQVVIDAYYEYRNDYNMIQQGLFRATAGSEKTSGEPGTLLFNSMLGGSICNYVLRGIGPSTLCVQGDDAKKTQIGLKADTQAIARIATYSDFKLKTKIGTNQEFCGCVEIEGVLVPSVHRMYKKITGQPFKTEKHFYEYKMSVLDKIRRIERVGHMKTVVASAGAIGVSYEEMDGLYDTVKSFSHISWEQYKKVAISIVGSVGTPALIM